MANHRFMGSYWERCIPPAGTLRFISVVGRDTTLPFSRIWSAPSGTVIAYEIEPELARKAAYNLQPWDNVEVRAESGTANELPRCDVIYVNAGATHPAGNWLDALNENGRLMFPLSGSPSIQTGVSLLSPRASRTCLRQGWLVIAGFDWLRGCNRS